MSYSQDRSDIVQVGSTQSRVSMARYYQTLGSDIIVTPGGSGDAQTLADQLKKKMIVYPILQRKQDSKEWHIQLFLHHDKGLHYLTNRDYQSLKNVKFPSLLLFWKCIVDFFTKKCKCTSRMIHYRTKGGSHMFPLPTWAMGVSMSALALISRLSTMYIFPENVIHSRDMHSQIWSKS